MNKIAKICFMFFAIMLLLASYSSAKAENIKLKFCIESVDHDFYNKLTNKYQVDYNQKNDSYSLSTNSALWQIFVEKKSSQDYFTEYKATFVLKKGEERSAVVGLDMIVDNWSKDNCVLLPGAAYNGNRFAWRKIQYSPKLLDPRDIGKNAPMIISDTPKLNISNGFSRIQERSGSMSIPSVGVLNVKNSRAYYLLTSQGNRLGDYGMSVEENRERNRGIISLRSPVMREYETYDSRASNDIPMNFKEGDSVEIKFKIFKYNTKDIPEFMEQFMDVRAHVYDISTYDPVIPFSSCFEISERKFNKVNFVEQWGYYSVGNRSNYFQDWQIGWTGGMISTYPLLFEGGDTTKNNVIRNFDWLYPNGISPSGLFWCSGEKGYIWIGGDLRKPHTKNWHLIRKSGDGLYYVIKQFDLMQKMGIDVKKEWQNGTKIVADKLVDIWNKNGQFGQFVDNVTGEIAVGGSTSGAIIPAALVLASKYYNSPEYMQVALKAGEYYYKNFIYKGITCGGPGDALQNPDSESAYAMLESFTLLYEYSRDEKWLRYAQDMANLYTSWVMAYDYKFPKNTTFGKLDMRTTGAVIANTQNKHGGPGMCTYSGIALLKLYRETANTLYLDILRETAFHLPQYLSRKDRPIKGMPEGYMNERVNTTDWAEGIGELFYGSTWAETSLMVTYIEIPGIYVDLYRKNTYAFDNIEVNSVKYGKNGVELNIKNPTKFAAHVKVMVDDEKSLKNCLGENALYGCQIISLEPNEEKTVTLK